MATTSINFETVQIECAKDSIVIANNMETIAGGRSLDCTGFTGVIKAGHAIIKKSNGDYAPMPVSESAYGTLPSGAAIVGILVNSVPVDKAQAAIMVRGTVNEAAAPYAYSSAIKTALPLIYFTQD